MVELPDEVKNMTTARPAAPARPAGAAPQGGRPSYGNRPQGGRPQGGRPQGGRPGGPGGRGGPGGARRPFQRRKRRMFGGGKVCQCCVRKIKTIDYKDLEQLKFFVSHQGKILPRRMSGACARHQRILSRAIKRARQIALIPFKQ